MTFEKRIVIETRNERGVFLYNLDAPVDRNHLVKTAAGEHYHPTIAAYIRNAQPVPGKLQVLITALGAEEYYGSNSNGDSFPEEALKHEGTDYGYKTFETSAKVYKHHVNRPDSPSYGDVVLSVWNDKMKRVELILMMDRSKAPDICARIDAGEYPALSMGCRVPYDVCSCCGNRAKTRAEYCEHLRFYMNRVPPGIKQKAFARNTIPKFFDISWVVIGADSIAKAMLKVASVEGDNTGEVTEQTADVRPITDTYHRLRRPQDLATANENLDPSTGVKIAAPLFQQALGKMATLGKKAVIEKEVPSNLSGNVVQEIAQSYPALRDSEPEFTREQLAEITGPVAEGYPDIERLNKVLSTLFGTGVVPKRPEFQTIALRCLGAPRLADDLYSRRQVFDPAWADQMVPGHRTWCDENVQISPDHFVSEILRRIVSTGMIPHKSYAAPALQKRITIIIQGSHPKLAASHWETMKTASHTGHVGMMLAIAGLYAALAKSDPHIATNAFERLIHNHPGAAVAIGAGVLAGISALTKRTGGQSDLHPGSLQPIPTVDSYVADRTAKTASIGAAAFLGVPAIYLASGLQEAKMRRDPYQQEGAVGKTVREHPDVLSGALVGGTALNYLSGNPVQRKLHGLFKAAGLLETAALAAASPAMLPLALANAAVDSAIIDSAGKLFKRQKGSVNNGHDGR